TRAAKVCSWSSQKKSACHAPTAAGRGPVTEVPWRRNARTARRRSTPASRYNHRVRRGALRPLRHARPGLAGSMEATAVAPSETTAPGCDHPPRLMHLSPVPRDRTGATPMNDTTRTFSMEGDYKVADITLADWGRKE